ncbi:MAG: VWA domain-containing protein [Planctomycetes bacterium]|nr:VWA domain-containing protein [Planctomycetota bacterium]
MPSTVSRRLALGLQAVLLALVVVGGADAAEDQARARKDLKKNAKRLASVDQALGQKQQQLEQILGAAKLDEARQRAVEQEIVQLRDAAGELIASVALADNEDAAEFLVGFAVATPSNDLYERTLSELGRLDDAGAVGWLASALGAGVLEDDKRGRGRAARRGGDDAWKAQVLIARAFEGIGSPLTVPSLAAQIEKGTTPQVVNACVKTAARKRDKRLIPALISFLGRVERQGGWEYYHVRQALVDLTGEDFLTQERWSGWWAANEATFDFDRRGDAREAATRERGPQEKVPTFFGSEIASNRMCFIIDISGSMVMTDRPLEHPATSDEEFARLDPESPEIKPFKRMERAKKALVEAVRGLQPTQRFNIIAFSSNNRMWKSTTVEASDANRADAIKFIEGLREDGGTNTYDAFEAALRDPLIDTIYLLSDGAPMVKVGNPGEQMRLFARDETRRVLDFVRRENRFRGVRIYTFGMDGPGVWHTKWGPRPVTLPTEADFLSILSGFMRDLANMTGGTFKSI